MTSNGSWMLIGLALVVGLIAGGSVALRVAGVRHAAQLRRSHDELQRKFAGTVDNLRAAQLRAQGELDKARAVYKRQLAVVGDEPRAAAARAEERLRAAYDEIDRMRRGANPPGAAIAELSDGFAATLPMPPGL